MKPQLSQRFQFTLAYLLVTMVVLSFLQSWLLAPRTVELSMSQFLELLRADKIERVAITDREIRGIAKPDALPTAPGGARDRLRELLGSSSEVRVFTVTRIPGIDDGRLITELEAHRVEFTGKIESTFLRDLFFGWVLPLGVMVAIWMFLMRRVGGGPTQALSFGRSKHKIYDRKELKTTFADVAGGGDRVRRRPRRARADPEPTARGDGRLRLVQGCHHHGRDEPPRGPRSGPPASGPLRPSGGRGQAGHPRPGGDLEIARPQRRPGAERRPGRDRRPDAWLRGRGPRQHRQRSGAARGAEGEGRRGHGRLRRSDRSRRRGTRKEESGALGERARHRRPPRDGTRTRGLVVRQRRPGAQGDDHPARGRRARDDLPAADRGPLPHDASGARGPDRGAPRRPCGRGARLR